MKHGLRLIDKVEPEHVPNLLRLSALAVTNDLNTTCPLVQPGEPALQT